MSKVLKEKRARRIASLQQKIRDHEEAIRRDRLETAMVRRGRRLRKGGPEWPRHRTTRMGGK